MRGDESYAGSAILFRFERRVRRPDRASATSSRRTRGGPPSASCSRVSATRAGRGPPTRTSTPRAPTSSHRARAPSTCRSAEAATRRRASLSRATWISGARARSSARSRRRSRCVHADRHQQLRRRPAGLDGEHARGERAESRARHSASISTPAASPRTPGSSSSASPGTATAAPNDRAEDVLARRRLHVLRQEGRLRQHRRLPGCPTTTGWPARRKTC